MGDSSMAEGCVEAPTVAGIHEGSEGEEDKGRVDESDRSFGGNRWPRQQTLALLKIRSDMDSVFRDSTLKGPLWEEVSRKLAELGYHRSAKKCKEKFENVYKYHKRTKDGRTNKTDGHGKAKAYRFFDELEAFQNTNNNLHSLSPPTPTSASMVNPTTNAIINTTIPNSTQAAVPVHPINPRVFNISSNLFSVSTSSSTTSNDDSYRGSGGKKRKWKEFFKRLTKDVIEKQEELQNKFLQTIEKYEQQRMAREEAWRVQEMARINQEHKILVQERSKTAAKDAAVYALLQKLSGQQVQENPRPEPPPPPPPLMSEQLSQQPKPPAPPMGNGVNNMVPVLVSVSPSPSRWPKAEVEALIKLRTDLNIKYHETVPKGPLWEEISASMRNLGYNRSSKRCKEKWENINKYYKKVKENNKSRPEDSKTCPYFHQLDAIYKQKITKNDNNHNNNMTVPLMVRPEQQWPPPPQEDSHHVQAETTAMIEEEDGVDDDNDTEEDEYEGNDYELVAKTSAASKTRKGNFSIKR